MQDYYDVRRPVHIGMDASYPFQLGIIVQRCVLLQLLEPISSELNLVSVTIETLTDQHITNGPIDSTEHRNCGRIKHGEWEGPELSSIEKGGKKKLRWAGYE